MPSTVSVTLPPDQGDAVLDTLLTLYQAQAESVHLAVIAYLDDRRSLAPLLEHRDALHEIEALIDLVGWRFGPRVGPVDIVGPPPLVRDVVYATLVDAVERFSAQIERYERGEIELERLQAARRAATVIFRVFVRIEGGLA